MTWVPHPIEVDVMHDGSEQPHMVPASRAKYLCDGCAADLANAKQIRPHSDVHGANNTRWVKVSCYVCKKLDDCVSRTDVPQHILDQQVLQNMIVVGGIPTQAEEYRRSLVVSLRFRNLNQLADSLRKPVEWLEGVLNGTN